MFDELYQDLKYQLRVGGFIIQIIFACIVLFILANILNSFFLTDANSENLLIKYTSLSGEVIFNLKHFWVWITHIFLHLSFFHLLFNMLNLYWFGMIVEDLIGTKHLKIIFFLSGIIGGIFFLISAHVFPWYAHTKLSAYGASGSVMGLIFAAAAISPNYKMRLILIGDVSIKYIALTFVLLDFIFLTQVDNSGGHAAHIGGAFFGYIYILLLRNGVDLTSIFTRKSSGIKRAKGKTRMLTGLSRQSVKEKKEYNLDRILEKIKQKGIKSLTTDEKSFLDNHSDR